MLKIKHTTLDFCWKASNITKYKTKDLYVVQNKPSASSKVL